MKKHCPTCKHAKWQTTPTGRRKFDSPGECLYPVPPLPHSYLGFRGHMPAKDYITKWTKEDCPCWEKENN